MRERLERLRSEKSIVTLLKNDDFAHLVIQGAVSGQEFMTVFTMVISFYFGTQMESGGKS